MKGKVQLAIKHSTYICQFLFTAQVHLNWRAPQMLHFSRVRQHWWCRNLWKHFL